MSVHLSLNDPTITRTATVLRCTVVGIQPVLILTKHIISFSWCDGKKGERWHNRVLREGGRGGAQSLVETRTLPSSVTYVSAAPGKNMKASVEGGFQECVALVRVCREHSAALKKKVNERRDASLWAFIPIVGKTTVFSSVWKQQGDTVLLALELVKLGNSTFPPSLNYNGFQTFLSHSAIWWKTFQFRLLHLVYSWQS